MIVGWTGLDRSWANREADSILNECWEFNPYYIMYYAIADIVFTIPTFLLLVSTFINRKNQILNSRYYWVPFILDMLAWLFVFVNNYDIFSDSLAISYAYAGSYIATNTDENEKSSELLMWCKLSLLVLILTIAPRSLLIIPIVLSVIVLVFLNIPVLIYTLFWSIIAIIMYAPSMSLIVPVLIVLNIPKFIATLIKYIILLILYTYKLIMQILVFAISTPILILILIPLLIGWVLVLIFEIITSPCRYCVYYANDEEI